MNLLELSFGLRLERSGDITFCVGNVIFKPKQDGDLGSGRLNSTNM